VALVRVIGGQYFEALRIPLRRGRVFDERDGAAGPPVALVNETAARSFWPAGDPLGERIRVGASFVSDRIFGDREVVGVVADVKSSGLERDARPEIYLPFAQQAVGSATIAVRTGQEPLGLVPAVRERLRRLDAAVPMSDLATMEQRIERSVATRSFTTTLFSSFGMVAVLLAAVGVYGLMASIVAQRRREIGIRLALGAESGQVLRMIVRQALAMTAAGTALGLGAALLLADTIRGLLFGIEPIDRVTFLAVPAVLALSAALASYLPARRASRIEPAQVLRLE
jgi:predicted permease